MTYQILDVACGSKMFWFNPNHEHTVYGDNRTLETTLCDGRGLSIRPDVQFDFTALPFPSASFNLVVYDPPHLKSLGDKAYMALKYGRLIGNWEYMLSRGFDECFRVLRTGGTLIFKWNEDQIPVSKVLSLCRQPPLIGHKSGKNSKTHWISFMKNGSY